MNAVCQLATQNVIAIYGLRDFKVEGVLRDFMRVLKIPFLTSGITNPNLTALALDLPTKNVDPEGEDEIANNKADYQIQMRPPVNHAIIDLIAHMGWRRISYVYDTSEGKSNCLTNLNHSEKLSEKVPDCGPLCVEL